MRSEYLIDEATRRVLEKMQAIDEGREEGDLATLQTVRDTLGWVLEECEELPGVEE